MDAMILGPTVERLAKLDREVVERPEISREVERRHHRLKGIFELAADRDSITHAQRTAGERLQAAIHGLHAARVGSNYGDSPRGSGGGSETDRRDRCRQIIAEAKEAVGPITWPWLFRVASKDLTAEDAPPPTLARGKHRATRDRHYAKLLQNALGRIAKAWGLE